MSLFVSNKWSLQLFDSISNLQIAGLERSAKFSHRSLNCDRFIIGPKHEKLTSDLLTQILKNLNFPEKYLSEALTMFEKSNQEGLGFERNCSECSYRLYFEFFDRYKPEPILNTGLLHLGYKWQCDNSENIKKTSYSYAPFFSGENAEQIVCKTLMGVNKIFCNTVVSTTIKAVADVIPEYRIITCAFEDVGCRRSFDVNVYKSKKKVSFIKEELEKIAAFFKIEQQVLDNFYNDSCNADLGHISGGTDTMNNPFFTIYFDDYTDFVKSNMNTK